MVLPPVTAGGGVRDGCRTPGPMPSAAGGPSSRGFTLVEVVVVAVIVSVLAGVAIGVYIAYVDAGQETSANNLAASLATFCAACKTNGGSVSPTGSGVPAGTIVSCDVAGDSYSIWTVPEKYSVDIVPAAEGEATGTITANLLDDGTTSRDYLW